MPAAPVMRMCIASPCGSYCAELCLLPPIPIEILRREPALERGFARRPFAVEHGEPGGVAAAALDDHVLAEQALIGEAEALRRPLRRGVERIAFPFVAPIAERFEGVAGDQVLRLGGERRALRAPANRRCCRPRPRASPAGFPSATGCRPRGRLHRRRRRKSAPCCPRRRRYRRRTPPVRETGRAADRSRSRRGRASPSTTPARCRAALRRSTVP